MSGIEKSKENNRLEGFVLKFLLSFFLIIGITPLVFPESKIPYFIDFGVDKFENSFYDKKFSADLVKTFPFNGAAEMSTFFMYLKDTYNIRTVVETGTFKGNTTVFFGSIFDVVHTIEISPLFYAESVENLKCFSNVHCHFGSSPDAMSQILPTLANEPVIFYLDAHWYEDWPLLAELTQISKTHRDNCIVVIDDFKVPGRSDVPYDCSPTDEYAFEYVEKHLEKIFSSYSVHYLIPKNVNSRAKFVAMPKKWHRKKR